MAGIYGEGALERISDYHMSDAYATKTIPYPDTPTYLEDSTSKNPEQYWNEMDE